LLHVIQFTSPSKYINNQNHEIIITTITIVEYKT